MLTMVGAALVGALLLLAAIRQHRDTWDLSATFVFVIGWVVNSASVLALTSGHYVERFDPAQQTTVRELVGGDGRFYTFAIVAGGAFAGFVLLRRLPFRPRLHASALVALVISVLANLSNTFSELPVVTLGAVFMALVLLTAAFLPTGEGARLGAAVFGLSMSTASMAFTAYNPDSATRPCTLAKCGPLDVLVNGLTVSENALALVMALALPFMVLAFRGRLRLFAVLHTVGVVWVTGSRTSLVAVAVTLLAVLVFRPTAGPRPRSRDTVARTAIVCTAAVAFLLPRYTVDNQAFSLRGYLWDLAQARVGEESPWFGLGSQAWSHLATDTSLIHAGAIYSPHNQWLELQYALGWLGVVLLVVWLVALVRENRDDVRQLAVVLIPALVIGATERAWSFGLPDWLVWALVALILMKGSGQDLGVHEPLVADARGVGDRRRQVRLAGDPLALDGRLDSPRRGADHAVERR